MAMGVPLLISLEGFHLPWQLPATKMDDFPRGATHLLMSGIVPILRNRHDFLGYNLGVNTMVDRINFQTQNN